MIVANYQPDIDVVNEKRTSKGKPEFTPEEFRRVVKRDRKIACIILGVAWIPGMIPHVITVLV